MSLKLLKQSLEILDETTSVNRKGVYDNKRVS